MKSVRGACSYLAVIADGSLHSREEVLDDAEEERQIGGRQLGNVHVLHRQQQHLEGGSHSEYTDRTHSNI